MSEKRRKETRREEKEKCCTEQNDEPAKSEGKKREMIMAMQKHEHQAKQAMRKNRKNLGYVGEIAEK
jgi:hypothetical protein